MTHRSHSLILRSKVLNTIPIISLDQDQKKYDINTFLTSSIFFYYFLKLDRSCSRNYLGSNLWAIKTGSISIIELTSITTAMRASYD